MKRQKRRFEWREGKEKKEITGNGCYASKVSKIAERKQQEVEEKKRNRREKKRS